MALTPEEEAEFERNKQKYQGKPPIGITGRQIIGILVVIILVAGIYAYMDSQNKLQAAKKAELAIQRKETEYQKGIELIKQGKWNDAAIALVLASKDNYEDSSALYNYAQAHEQFNKNDYSGASMANHYMQDIPDTYTGLFKEDIFKFKQECVQKEKIAEEELKVQYAPQKIIDKNGKQIWKVYVASGYFNFTGNYKGSGNFIAKLSNSNQDLVGVLVNEIGDFIADKTIAVPYKGWYYLEVYGSDGSWTFNWKG